eukprot:1369830-Rhodomonas_salina.1
MPPDMLQGLRRCCMLDGSGESVARRGDDNGSLSVPPPPTPPSLPPSLHPSIPSSIPSSIHPSPQVEEPEVKGDAINCLRLDRSGKHLVLLARDNMVPFYPKFASSRAVR